mgnify:CR=1 FL=1|jgi:2-oxo-3-hexenedioate decarboxylase
MEPRLRRIRLGDPRQHVVADVDPAPRAGLRDNPDMLEELTAAALLDACDHARSLDRSRFETLTDLAHAEALQTGIAVARLARGERQVGYKIGFTNRSIWPLYQVFHPIWAPVWTATLRAASPDDPARVTAARFVEPRLEPEIVVGLRESPAADTPEAVLAAAEWIAHGFEIVQSPFPDWRFSGAEAIAAQGLHGALLLGPRRPLSILDEAWPSAPAGSGEPIPGPLAQRALARIGDLEVELRCDGRTVERGRGANVLDGPMHAIAYMARELRRRGRSIEPGSLVSTGTLTDAQPLKPGQRWQSRVSGLDLPGLTVVVD